MGPKEVLPLRVRVELEVTVIKGYSTLPRSPQIEPHYQLEFSVMPRTSFFRVNLNPLNRVKSMYSRPHHRYEQRFNQYCKVSRGLQSLERYRIYVC